VEHNKQKPCSLNNSLLNKNTAKIFLDFLGKKKPYIWIFRRGFFEQLPAAISLALAASQGS